MDSTSLTMLFFVGFVGFVLSVLALFDLKSSLFGKKEPPILGLIAGLLSTAIWFIFGIAWTAYATEAAFAAFGYLWYGLGVSFSAVSVVLVFQMLRLTIYRSAEPDFIFNKHDED